MTARPRASQISWRRDGTSCWFLKWDVKWIAHWSSFATPGLGQCPITNFKPGRDFWFSGRGLSYTVDTCFLLLLLPFLLRILHPVGFRGLKSEILNSFNQQQISPCLIELVCRRSHKMDEAKIKKKNRETNKRWWTNKYRKVHKFSQNLRYHNCVHATVYPI